MIARLREPTTSFPASPAAPLLPPPTTSMVLEATMLCIYNSGIRNKDTLSRFEAQADAFDIAKTQPAKQSTAGVLAMAVGKGVTMLVTPTNYLSKVLSGDSGLRIGGEANLTAAIRIAQLAHKNRKNKKLQQRIIVLVGSQVKDEKNLLEVIGKNLMKNNVALDVVDFGESDDKKPEKLEALVVAVNSGGNSHITHIPAGDVIFSSPILSEDRGSDFAATACLPELNSYTEDGRPLQMDEDKLLRQAHEMLEGSTDEVMSVLCHAALQRAFQEDETGTQSDASKVFGDQPFAHSLPDVVFLNDLSKKDSLEWKELLIGPSEPRKQHKKYKRPKKKKPET